MKHRIALLVLLIVASLTLAACGGGGSAAVTELKVEMSDFMFNPATFTVPAGKEITIDLSNKGAVEHEIVIMKLGTKATTPFDDDDEPNVYWEAELEAGGAEKLTFTAPSAPGEYELVCGIAGHLEAGMTGKLMVVNP